jgi:hypothetical protein
MSDTRSVRNAGSLIRKALSPREILTTAEILKRSLDRAKEEKDEGLRRTLSLTLAKFGQAATGLGLTQKHDPRARADASS